MAAAALVTVPAVILRLSCAGNTCQTTGGHPAAVPFCPLPAALKSEIEAGYRSGRSPDILGVTGSTHVIGGTTGSSPRGVEVAWPSISPQSDTRVPIVFSGSGLARGASVPDGAGLDAIAPTLASALGFDRPHPEVRAGEPLGGIVFGRRPRLVLEVAWKGIGSAALRASPTAWPFLSSLERLGAGTLDATTGSLPLDPAATLTTIGTGGLPFQHGITGTILRGTNGRVVDAWHPGAPTSVIATLADDWDHAEGERPLVGLVADASSDRGIVGDGWYVGHDTDSVLTAHTAQAQAAAVNAMLAKGFGRDGTTDILAVVMRGSLAEMDRELRTVVAAANGASRGSLVVVVAGTGQSSTPGAGPSPIPGERLVQDVERRTGLPLPVVQAAVPGGLFLDEAVLAKTGVTGQVVQQALADVSSPAGGAVMDQAFQGFAVSFARYC